MRTHTLNVERLPRKSATDYIARCSCGWESIPTTDLFDAQTTPCAVYIAEAEGAERAARRRALMALSA